MANGNRKGLFRSPAVLFVAFVTLLGLTGLVTAFWSTEARVQGNVQTGDVGIQWWDSWTNDDGEGSLDPAEPFPWGSTLARYDLDVANCYVEWQDGDQIQFRIDNAYPSYYCTVEGYLAGSEGSVPVMTAGAEYSFIQHAGYIPEWSGPTCWSDNGTPEDGEDDFEYAETMDGFGGDCEMEGSEYNPFQGDFIVEAQYVPFDVDQTDDMLEVSDPGTGEHVLTVWVDKSCGDVLNPAEPNPDATYRVSVHVEEGAEPNSNYQMEVFAIGVDANSYDGACALTAR